MGFHVVMGWTRKTVIASGVAVIGVLGPIWFGIAQIHHDDDTVRQGKVTLEQEAKQFGLERAKHEEELFQIAVAQLASSTQAVRLAAVHTFEQIVDATPSQRPDVVDILCSFIRVHAVRGPSDPPPSKASRPQTDVAAALNVLGHRNPGKDGQTQIDLNDVYLPGAQLAGAHLGPVRFGDANLTGADLQGANLEDPDAHAMTGKSLGTTSFGPRASLAHANLTGAHLLGADFDAGANLSGADLTGADLTSVDFQPRVNLSGVTLLGAQMSYVKAAGVNLSHARLGPPPEDTGQGPSNDAPPSLRPAVVSDSDFRKSDLSDASIDYVDWSTANVSGAVLAGVSLRHTDLTHVLLDAVNKRGVDLRGINLRGENNLLFGPDDELVPLDFLLNGEDDSSVHAPIVPVPGLDPEP